MTNINYFSRHARTGAQARSGQPPGRSTGSSQRAVKSLPTHAPRSRVRTRANLPLPTLLPAVPRFYGSFVPSLAAPLCTRRATQASWRPWHARTVWLAQRRGSGSSSPGSGSGHRARSITGPSDPDRVRAADGGVVAHPQHLHRDLNLGPQGGVRRCRASPADQSPATCRSRRSLPETDQKDLRIPALRR